MTTTAKNPGWWTNEHTTAWEKVKEAFRRDWEQTKADVSKKAGHELNQNIGDTVKQAAGKEAIPAPGAPNPAKKSEVKTFEQIEPAYRFGHGARKQYGKEWNEGLESNLARDWKDAGHDEGWADTRDYVRQGFDGNGSL
jgi:hypothetical protein